MSLVVPFLLVTSTFTSCELGALKRGRDNKEHRTKYHKVANSTQARLLAKL